ncbi:hypothetical protein BVC80_1065g49 [Macleaya cordata]|uniref:Uncharacterized protein n=1 Tax=Macleaya cordata TaxID=56857 RepID=A0A200RCR9_MACCD|nr:hypothetical protein BVC80_1065g49 [Macleaya cordata]
MRIPAHPSTAAFEFECIEPDPKSINRQTSLEMESFGLAHPCFCCTIPRRERSKRSVKKRYANTFPRRERPKRGVNKRNSISKQHRKLDSNMFECYLEDLWRTFSEEKKNSFAYLDCLWFSLYRKQKTKTKASLEPFDLMSLWRKYAIRNHKTMHAAAGFP